MELKISSPCSVPWDSMVGDNRIRFCGKCNLNVYNLVAMSPDEVTRIVRKTQGRLCGRLYMRDDRTATLLKCSGSGARKKLRRGVSVAIILVLAGMSWFLRGMDEPDRSIHPAWVRTVLNWIEPQRRGQILPGGICPPPALVQPPPAPPTPK